VNLTHSDGCPIIDDKSNRDLLDLDGNAPAHGRGRIPRDYSRVPIGGLPYSGPPRKIFPRSEWKDRIKDLQKRKIVLSEMARKAGVKTKNQGQTNFCWCNAPVLCVEITRAASGEKYVELSPASVACQINNFRNEGGWGGQAVRHLAEHGASPVKYWPANAINKTYNNDESQAARMRHRVTEWTELRPQSFDDMMSELLCLRPVAIGLNYWRHEITAVDPVILADGRFGARIWNSWGDGWGQNGMAILDESHCTPDDAISPLSVVAL
jgi:hypothetical protein